jgi:ABC-type antimicrobial peptide transport system permease subunit
MKLSPSGIGMVVRYDGATAAVAGAIRRSSEQMSPEQVIFGVESMNEVISDSLVARRFSMILFGFFAALALVLASVGIYGVISFFVGQHTHEIGVRLALGARPADILRHVLGRGGLLAAIGIGAGFASALALTRLLAGMLYGVSATDPFTFGAVAALLFLVALLACYLPARRATRVDPMVALRSE